MTANEFVSADDILIDQQPDLMLRIIHQPQDADGTGSNVKKLLHMFCIREGKTCAADLFGELGCFKFLFSGHQKKVKCSFLGIAQKQVFADFCAKQLFDRDAALYRKNGIMIHAVIGDVQLIQQIISADFSGKPSGGVFRASVVNRGIDGNGVHGIPPVNVILVYCPYDIRGNRELSIHICCI